MRTVEAKPVHDGLRVKWTLEQQERETQTKVRIDWLRFTVPLDAVVHAERSLEKLTGGDLTVQAGYDKAYERATLEDNPLSLSRIVATAAARALIGMLRCGLTIGPAEDKGMDFYAARVALMHEGAVVGHVLAGSKDSKQAGTVHFNLFGSAMLAIPRDRMDIVRSYVAHAKGWITRVDLAVDVWSGRSVVDVQSAWKNGEFDVRGKRPSQQEVGSWSSGHSRTFNVGSRGTGKMLRCYEKGHEQFGDPILAAMHGCAEWLRYEVELRNNHRIIDLDVLTRPADFFAGAYAFCASLLDDLDIEAKPQRIKTDPEVKDVTAIAAAKRVAAWLDGTAGAAIAALFEQGGDLLADIVERNRHRVARRLKGFSPSAVAEAFEQVAERMAPARVPLPSGAV